MMTFSLLDVIGLVAGMAALPAVPAQAPPPQAQSQAPPASEEPGNDSDPTKSVFLSLRNEFFNLRDGNWSNALVVRSDKVYFRRHPAARKLGLLTRWDLPFVTTHAKDDTHAGLGDIYGQVLFVPVTNGRLALALGSGMVFPTATDASLGKGKWQVVPILAPVWFFTKGKGFTYVRVQDYVSFAGDDSRPDVHYLLVAPTVFRTFHRRWWVILDAETKVNWAADRTTFRPGLEIGRVFRARVGFAGRLEIPMGDNREGDWTAKVVMTVYRPKK